MTRTISLITATVGAALLFAVPAWGDNWGADLSQTSARPSPDPVDLLVAKNGVVDSSLANALTVNVSRPDSHDIVQPTANGYIDASDRARRINTVVPTAYLDAHERSAPPKGSSAVSSEATGSGSDRDWPQLGIGFGLGLLLAVGLFLAMRMTRVRPLAH